jgi:DinB family protein
MKKSERSKSKRPAARRAAKSSRKPIMRHSREGARRPSKGAASRKAASPPAAHLKRQFLDRFSSEFPTTLKLMRAYPAGQDHFRPHERSQPALKLVHTFTIENRVGMDALRGDLTMPPAFPPPPATLAEAIEAYETGAQALIDTLHETPEEKLFEMVPFFTGPKQVGPIPVIDLLWRLLSDAIHHRGQLSVYVRMAGGKVPSIYGPSADEPWM